MVEDIRRNRSEFAAFITILTAIIVLSTARVLVLRFESQSADSNIKSGWDAFRYSLVTITTVGYGDRYPVTVGGRVTAMFIMITGVGIIGALASMLASLLVGSSSSRAEEGVPSAAAPTVEAEIIAIRNELAEMRQLLEKTATGGDRES